MVTTAALEKSLHSSFRKIPLLSGAFIVLITNVTGRWHYAATASQSKETLS